MGFLDRLGNTIKAVSGEMAAASSVPFSGYGGYGGSYNSGSYYGAWGGSSGSSPGSTFDYDGEAGDLLENGIVAACVDAISQALTSVSPVLKQRKGEDWETITDHPLLDLLNTPNDNYGDAQLWMATTAAECTTGNAFWRVVWNRTRTRPVQLWWEGMVAPRWDSNSFIKDYVMWIDGRPHALSAAGDYGKPNYVDGDCIIHFRYALNPKNSRIGWTPLLTARRQVYGDNGVATYHSALIRNSSTASMVVVPKEGATGALTPRILEQLTDAIERKLRGEGAGRVAGTSLPVDIHKMGFSPDEMAITEVLGYYERRVCASLRVHPMILGLGAGDDFKTYANFEQAIEDFWLRTVIPRLDRRKDELETQLFPLFELDRNKIKMDFDLSGVKALDENQDRLFARLQRATGKPFMTPNEARAKTNLPPIEGGDELADNSLAQQPQSESEAKSKTIFAMPANWSFKSTDEFKLVDANGMSHGDDGRFDGGNGSGTRAQDSQAVHRGRVPEQKPSTKAERAKAAHKLTDRRITRYSEEFNEPQLARDIKKLFGQMKSLLMWLLKTKKERLFMALN
jgi:HK97 family phage portal protein